MTQTKHIEKRLALLGGEETTAQRINGEWFVGGDRVCFKDEILIAAKEFKSGKWAWHRLQGAVLTFNDFLTDEECGQQEYLNRA